MKRNYDSMISSGIKINPPSFMKSPITKVSQRSTKQTLNKSLGQDLRRNTPRACRKTNSYCIDDLPLFDIKTNDCSEEVVNKVFKLFKLKKENFFCYKCKLDYYESCPHHNVLQYVKDSTYTSGSKDYSQKSLPSGLTISKSNIPGAGLGVFTSTFISKWTVYGPYTGLLRFTSNCKGHSGDYAWDLGHNSFIDGRNRYYANWMRFVNFSVFEHAKNLFSFQLGMQIFYLTTKNIYPGEELTVWYGTQYANTLGCFIQPVNDLKCNVCFEKFDCYDDLKIHTEKTFELKRRTETFGFYTNTCGCFCSSHIGNTTVIVVNYSNGKSQINSALKTKMLLDAPTLAVEKLFSCSTCSFSTVNRKSLTYHERTHTGKKIFECNECDYKCTCSSHLKNHKLTHSGEKPFHCDQCDYKCTTSGGLNNHKLTHSGEKPFHCDQCDYKCTTSSHLKDHKLTHSGEKPFHCDQCDYKCTTSSSLKNHKLTHSGEKPFHCDQCDYKCTCSTNLKNHKLTHSGEKPFHCDQCDYKCTTSSSLKNHKLTHSGEKPFLCDQCDYKCTQFIHLKNHRLTHSGEKPFLCDQCDYKCTTSSGLKKHKLTHSGEKPFHCDQCDYKCSRSDNLKTHKQKHLK